MNGAATKQAIEEVIDYSDDRDTLVAGLMKLAELIWYDGLDIGKKNGYTGQAA